MYVMDSDFRDLSLFLLKEIGVFSKKKKKNIFFLKNLNFFEGFLNEVN